MQKEDPNLGLLSEQHKPCHQWCLFVTKLLSPFQTTSTPKCSMNQGEKIGVTTNGSNKTQQGTRKPYNEKKKPRSMRQNRNALPLSSHKLPFFLFSHLILPKTVCALTNMDLLLCALLVLTYTLKSPLLIQPSLSKLQRTKTHSFQ